MSSRIKITLWLILVIFVSILSLSYATTNCEQTFTFFGITWGIMEQRDVTFWIGEDVSGECYGSYLIQVALEDTSSHLIMTYNSSYSDWDWLKEGLKKLGMPKYTELKFNNEKGIWSDSMINVKISVPEPDSEMAELLKDARRRGIEDIWTQKYGVEGIILPEFKGIKTKLVYYYPKGFYIDYQISAVYFDPFFKHLIIFTHQPRLAVGFDTMHGFLIFKIIK